MSTRCHSFSPRNRRTERTYPSSKHTSGKTKGWTSRQRRKSSPSNRGVKSNSRTRFQNRSESNNKRSSRGQSYSRSYRGYDVDYKEELRTVDSEKRKERALSHPHLLDQSRLSSGRERRGTCNRNSDYWGRECKLSEVKPDCRLRGVKASGGSRDFRKWFGKLPPNCRIDKDVRTDRGILRRDNFQSSTALDRYLGIKSSKSPSDRRRRR